MVCPVCYSIAHSECNLLLLSRRVSCSEDAGVKGEDKRTSLAPSCILRTESGALRYSATCSLFATTMNSSDKVAMRNKPLLVVVMPRLTAATGSSMNLMAAAQDPTYGMGQNPTDGNLGVRR